MLPGSFSGTVNEWRTEVTVNGVVRAHSSVSLDSEMVGDLPDSVIASGGLGGSGGSVVWAPQEAVQGRPVIPWAKVAGWPPSPGDVVRVRVTDGITWWTRFTGLIDKTTGDAGSFQSSLIDGRDRLEGTFTHEALLRHMPPYLENGAYRSIGLNHWFPLVQALRSVGLCNVPPIEGPSALSVPMQGSVWPEAGTVTDSTGTAGTGPSFFWQDYGYGAGDFSATYQTRLQEPSSATMQATMVVAGSHSGVATMDILYGSRAVRLRVNESRGVSVFYSATGSGSWVSVASVGGGSASVDTVVQLLIKGGVWTLRTSNGAVGTGSQVLGSGSMDRVVVSADANSRIAGVQVSHPNSTAREFASLGFKPSMRFAPSGLASTMDMSPALKGRKLAEFVNEVLSSTLTAAWWDEEGALVLRPSDLLRSAAPVAEIGTAMDVTSLDWEDSLLSVRSAVEVSWRDPSISKGRQRRLELWRGPEESFVSTDDPREQFIEPGADTEWFGVDRALRKLDSSNWGAYNSRRGSYSGLRVENASGDEIPTTVASVSIATRNLYADSLIVTTTINSLVSTYEAISATSEVATALRPQMRGHALPVVRGMGIGQWVDATYTTTAGPSTAPVLTHDLGYWGGDFFGGGSVAQRVGDFLASMVSAPQPTITGLGLMYDPRRQVGDVYTLRSDWLGVELRLLVVAISESHGGGSSQSLTVRVISATNLRAVTYADLEAAWASGNYAGLQSVWGLLTYNNLAANPLEGAPG